MASGLFACPNCFQDIRKLLLAAVAGAERYFWRTWISHAGIIPKPAKGGNRMIVKYGTYAHENNEVTVAISRRSQYSQRGILEYTRESWVMRGFIQAASQSALTTAIDSLRTAYATNGYDVGLYLDDGTTLTSHYMTSSNARGGVRVVDLEFPEGEGAEYSTFRSYGITLEADFYNTSDNFLEWDEEISFEGTGGPLRVFIPTLDGLPQEQITAQYTTYRATQEGSALGLGGYPFYPPPIWPDAELQFLRRTSQKAPKRIGSDYVGYGISWSYTFESVSPISGRPTLR